MYASQIADGDQLENVTIDDLQTRFKPMEGFGGNPLEKESWWMLTEGMIERAEDYGIDGDIVILAHTLGMKNYALDLLQGYETLYTTAAGGSVKKAKRANPGTENRKVKDHWVETDELGAAKKAADAGHQVFFLPKTKVQGVNNLDTIIDNDLADIKHIFTPTETAIKTAINGAKKQGANTVLLEIVTPDLSWETVEKNVKNRIGSHVRKALVYWRGKLYTVVK